MIPGSGPEWTSSMCRQGCRKLWRDTLPPIVMAVSSYQNPLSVDPDGGYDNEEPDA